MKFLILIILIIPSFYMNTLFSNDSEPQEVEIGPENRNLILNKCFEELKNQIKKIIDNIINDTQDINSSKLLDELTLKLFSLYIEADSNLQKKIELFIDKLETRCIFELSKKFGSFTVTKNMENEKANTIKTRNEFIELLNQSKDSHCLSSYEKSRLEEFAQIIEKKN